jgi:putative tricarboxylic transport membrane protein
MKTVEILSGAVPVALGIIFLSASRNLPFGTSSHMGPGFFPISLSLLLCLLGTLVLVRGLRSPMRVPSQWPALRPFMAVSACPILFALLIERAGLVVAVIVICVVARMAVPVAKRWDIVLVPVGTAAFCVIVFVTLMGMPLPIFGK